MSLAEELLADLEDGSDEEEQEELKDLIRQNVGEDVPMVDVKGWLHSKHFLSSTFKRKNTLCH